MADKRMFAKSIVDSDLFLEMPMSARLLYYDLGMRADDEGFVNSPRKIMRMTGATVDDMNILITKQFIIPFDSGIVVIKHWRIHNYIRADRKHMTTCVQERSLLTTRDSGEYILKEDVQDLEEIPVSNEQLVLECLPDSVQKAVAAHDNKNNKKDDAAHQKEVDEVFEKVWQLYIRRKGKNGVTKAAKEEIFNIGFDRMKACIEKYAAEVNGSEERFILMGSTFFNGRFRDYLEDTDKPEETNSRQLKRVLQ